MTRREFFDSLDNEFLAAAIVSLTKTYENVLPVLKVIAEKPKEMSEDDWISYLKTAYTINLLKSEVPTDVIESVLGDDIIEA